MQEIQLELGDRLDLSSYLLEPVQRIPRYKLFLVDLVKTYTNYENEKCETDSRISKLSVDSDETGGSNGESSDNEETPLESLKLAKTMIECVLTAVDEIMALESITDCPVSEVFITLLGKRDAVEMFLKYLSLKRLVYGRALFKKILFYDETFG